MVEKTRLEYLFELVLANKATSSEREEMAGLMALPQNELLTKTLLTKAFEAPKQTTDINVPRQQAILRRILGAEGDKVLYTGIKRRFGWQRMVAAAAILLFICAGGYYGMQAARNKQTAYTRQHDVAPGGNKAVLILASGNKIILTGAQNGQLATEKSAVINKTADGQLSYTPTKGTETDTSQYNLLSTPVGGQYKLTLADGTTAVLDAGSSIKYPVAFNGKYRSVQITGQVYFEVVHNPAQPFKVLVKGQTVEDLGTWFNINAYDNEAAVTTTLLQGSVRVSAGNVGAVTLKPQQQAQILAGRYSVSQADTEEIVAWKNGYFSFNDEGIEAIMRQLARWYNIDVQYSGKIPAQLYTAKISRFKKISQVLTVLEATKTIHFNVEGRRVVISN